MQTAAVHVEPRFGALHVRTDAFDQCPESPRMIHFDEVRHFVRGQIVENEWRRQNEPPGIRQHAGARARAPATRLIADGYAFDGDAELRRRLAARGVEITLGLALEKIAEAARKMRLFAGNADE